MIPLQIFLGWDPREQEAYDVADFSIRRRSSSPVLIHPLRLANLGHVLKRPIERRDGKLWCPISEAPMATEFAISRFCVPFLQREGWALFADSDILCLGDIAELFALAEERYAVMVVKHQQIHGAAVKMDGQTQTFYARKNWSSVVLWNCAHRGNLRLTPLALDTWPGRELHAFSWLKDREIGELPASWNHLVGVSAPVPVGSSPKLLHYTLGGPWFADWSGGPLDNLWLHEREIAKATKGTKGTKEPGPMCPCYARHH